MNSPVQRVQPQNDRPLGGLWPSTLPPPARHLALLAFAVAGVSDLISVWLSLMPPAQIVVDVITALALWALLGRRWVLLPALIAEAIPVVSMFPTWTMVAGAYLLYSRRGDSFAAGHR